MSKLQVIWTGNLPRLSVGEYCQQADGLMGGSDSKELLEGTRKNTNRSEGTMDSKAIWHKRFNFYFMVYNLSEYYDI